jgi:hypothetical protein
MSMVAISRVSGPGGESGEIRSRQRVRRSSAMASANDGVRLAVYQGWWLMGGVVPLWFRY